MKSADLCAGEWVEVRTKEEILATLDENGKLEGLSFMPEMFAYCGKRFRVFKRAHKTCDPPNGMAGRRMLHAVHLEEVRCNGSAHDGCQARCLIFWKDSWLKRVASETAPATVLVSSNGSKPVSKHRCSEQDVIAGTRDWAQAEHSDDPTFICQSTQLAQATLPLHWWDFRQYVEDWTSGNVGLGRILGSFALFLYAQVASAGLGVGSLMRWGYEFFQKARAGNTYPWREGDIPRGVKTPTAKLDVMPGEWVRIRPQKEILATINDARNNRGMSFDPEMVPYCGGSYQVLGRIDKIINEKTGKMQELKNDCIMLDQVVCKACYSKHRRFCPRSIYPYWREIWLERVEPKSVEQPEEKRMSSALSAN